MKKVFYFIVLFFLSFNCKSNELDTLTYKLDDITIVSLYRNNLFNASKLNKEYLENVNKGQEPSFIFKKLPSVISYSDTGNEYGYSYYRIRGIDQTRINVTLDGMPLNEGEDMGVYFSNFPDLVSSINSIQVNNGSSISNNGVSGYGGCINFESVKLGSEYTNIYIGGGSFLTNKIKVEYNSNKIGKFAFNIRATKQESSGFRDYAYNDSKSFFSKIAYYINDNNTIDFLTFSGLSKNGQGWIGSTIEELEINMKHNGCSSYENDNFFQTINKFQYKGVINNTIITASIYYNYLKGFYNFDLDNYMIKIEDPNWIRTYEIDTYNLKHHMYGSNFAIKNYFNNFSWTNGINAYTFNRSHIGTYNLGDEVLWDNIGYKNDINIFTKLKYTNNSFNISSNVQYRHANFDYIGDIDFNKINWDFINFNVESNYNISKTLSIYSSITHTNREPTRTDMFGGNENFVELYTKQHESVYDYEFGFNINTNKLNLNLNLYLMDFNNELILNGEFGKNGLPIKLNTAKSYRYGIEFKGMYSPTKWLSLTNNSSFSKNEVYENDIKYNHIMSPECIINQDITFNHNNFKYGADFRYRSKMYIDLNNQYELSDNIKVNAFINYTYKNITIGGVINNIFNNISYSNGMLGANGVLYFIDAPINFMADIKFNF